MTTRGASDRIVQRRLLTYGLLGLAVVVSFVFLRDKPWQGSEGLHTLMEALASFLAFIVGSIALVRFQSRKDNTFLIIGAGFLGAGLLDTYHAVVTSVWIKEYLPSNLDSLIPWSWSASRLYLSAGFVLSYFAWRRSQRLGDGGRLNEWTIYVVVILLTLSSFLFFALVPLPRAYYPEYFTHRPQELLPALLFLFALICYFRKANWHRDAFEYWLILSLIIGFLGQALVMPFSARLFDFQFDFTHLLKIVSYLCVLIGLFRNMAMTFRQAELRAAALAKSKATLKREVAVRTAQLKDSEALFKQAARTARLGHWSVDDAAGSYLSVSDEYADIFGYTTDEFLKRYTDLHEDMKLVHPDDREKVERAYQENGSINVEYRIVRADGSVRNVYETAIPMLDATGRTNPYHGTLQDITALRNVERELHISKLSLEKSEASLRQAAHIARLGHWHADELKGEITTVSEEFARLHGYTVDEYMERFRKLETGAGTIHAEDRARVSDAYDRNQDVELEFRIIRRDGAVRHVHEVIKYIHDASGTVVASEGTIQDITDIKEAENRLRAAKDAAEAANHAKSSFLSNMSHELRTPLNAIIGYSDMVRDDVKRLLPDSSSLIADLQVISREGRHLSALITDVLELSKISAGEAGLQVEQFPIEDLVKEVVLNIAPIARQRGNMLDVTCPDAIGHMKSDMDKVRQVLSELMSNSAKFSENGRIEVDVRREERDGVDFIKFQVRDNGIGMSAEHAEGVFAPFIRAENSTTSGQPGTGLGLAISKELCRILGGSIDLESEPDKGSVFTVVLPAEINGGRTEVSD